MIAVLTVALWITGTGMEVTVSVEAGLVEAPGAGLLTVKDPVPWFCRSDALRATVKVVALTNVVGRGAVFQRAAEFDSKPVPEMVMAAALPGGT